MGRIVKVVSQLLLFFVVRPLFLWRVRVINHLPEPHALQNFEQIIMASNHHKMTDPFLITVFIPVRYIPVFVPFSVMTTTYYYHSPLKPILWALGCFPHKYVPKYRNVGGVLESTQHLSTGHTLLIFPEGKLSKEGTRLPAKPGITTITRRFPRDTTAIIPVRITYGWRITITYGAPRVDFADAEAVLDAVYAM